MFRAVVRLVRMHMCFYAYYQSRLMLSDGWNSFEFKVNIRARSLTVTSTSTTYMMAFLLLDSCRLRRYHVFVCCCEPGRAFGADIALAATSCAEWAIALITWRTGTHDLSVDIFRSLWAEVADSSSSVAELIGHVVRSVTR